MCATVPQGTVATTVAQDWLANELAEYGEIEEKLRNSLATSRVLLHLRASLRQPGRPRVLLTSFSRGGGPAQSSLCPAQKKSDAAAGTSRARCRPDVDQIRSI